MLGVRLPCPMGSGRRGGRRGECGVEEAYRQRNNAYVPWLGSPTPVGGHLFLNAARGLLCVERGTGKTAWEERLGRCVYTVADGRLSTTPNASAAVLPCGPRWAAALGTKRQLPPARWHAQRRQPSRPWRASTP